MNSLQDPTFFLLISYGVSALLVAGELVLLWRRRSRVQHDPGIAHAAEDRA